MTLGNTGRITAEKDNEFFCKTCRARCTRSPHDGIEFGHLVGCPNRPDKFDGFGGSGGNHHFDPNDEAEPDPKRGTSA